MKVLFEIGLIFCVLVVISTGQDGYYWRDYIGDLPNDAVPAGTDGKGRNIYVGQTVHYEGATVLPGTIRTDQRKMFYEYSYKEYSTIENVKILCSPYHKQFHWVETSVGNSLADLTHNKLRLIPGGTDQSRPLAIGRISITQDEVIIGKALIINDKFEDIWVLRNGTSSRERSFEVLLYDTNIIHETQVSRTKRPIVITIYN